MPRAVSLISSGSAADTEHPLDDRVEPGINIFLYLRILSVLCLIVFPCFSILELDLPLKILSFGKIT